jgi:MATE family multidrug resistance protein
MLIRLSTWASLLLCKCFEVGLFTGIWLSGLLGTTSLAANQIALSLASLTFMFAMGLSVAVTIRVGKKGLMDYVKFCSAIHIFIILLETVFAVRFHQYLPQVFCKC